MDRGKRANFFWHERGLFLKVWRVSEAAKGLTCNFWAVFEERFLNAKRAKGLSRGKGRCKASARRFYCLLPNVYCLLYCNSSVQFVPPLGSKRIKPFSSVQKPRVPE